MSRPELSTLVVSWCSKADVERLAASFPVDPRHELVVVDNRGELEKGRLPAHVELVAPGRNLGFAGGCNLAARVARASKLLLLNPDCEPVGSCFDDLLEGFEARPRAAGLVPKLVSLDGVPQTSWQLRSLPSAADLIAHAFFWNPTPSARSEPVAGAPIAQPAAAALALRREPFDRVGGFDVRFHPAWFEDVDLARRLDRIGVRLDYWPAATFRHRGGAALGPMGYGRFLAAYDRNLALYLRLHHGRVAAALFRAAVPVGALLRLALLPVRKPRRATNRREAAAALWGAALGALGGWRRLGGLPG